MKELDQLLNIMRRLRDPENGCPWDREQTHQTILPFTIEEVYELAEAIQQGNADEMRDELGDLLFQIIFYCQMSGEEGGFTFRDVVETINKKLVHRHPHVFAGEDIRDADSQSLSWERIKTRERREKHGVSRHILEGVSQALPALIHALKLQKKAASVGFDWGEAGPVLDKIEEEIGEIRTELSAGSSQDRLSEEIGDVLFACVNFARHTGIDPETALMKSNRKFRQRFAYIEEQLRESGRSLEDADLDEMEALWQEAKRR